MRMLEKSGYSLNWGIHIALILNILSAFLCYSMAKKQGRRPLRWFFLGLLFTVFAIAILYWKGRRGRQRAFPNVQTDEPTINRPRFTDEPQRPALQQPGYVDLNALREAVNAGGMRQSQSDALPPTEALAELEPDRRVFLDLVESVAPTITFPGHTPQSGDQLRSAWLRLGREFVYSDEGGGMTDSKEFYQLEPDGDGMPVLFYPVIVNGASVPQIQFACPVKRFRHSNEELEIWVSRQPAESFAVATLFRDETAGETVLLAAGILDPDSAPVRATTIGQFCRQVRSEASDLRRDIPARFGGIWITN